MLRETLAGGGVSIPAALTDRGPFDLATGLAGARQLLGQDQSPTVIVGAHDLVAYGALNAARKLGREVPRDVSVVGFDDLPEARWPLLQLTTVAVDLETMARRAAALLVDRSGQGPVEPYRHEWFPSHLVECATLGPA